MMLLVASRAAPCTGPVLGMNIPGSNQSLLSEILSETCKLPVTIVFDTAVLYSGNASNADNFISGCQNSRELVAVPFIKVRREPPRSTRKSTDIKIEFKTMSPDIIKSRGKSAPVSTSNNGAKYNLGVEDDNGSIESNLITSNKLLQDARCAASHRRHGSFKIPLLGTGSAAAERRLKKTNGNKESIQPTLSTLSTSTCTGGIGTGAVDDATVLKCGDVVAMGTTCAGGGGPCSVAVENEYKKDLQFDSSVRDQIFSICTINDVNDDFENYNNSTDCFVPTCSGFGTCETVEKCRTELPTCYVYSSYKY